MELVVGVAAVVVVVAILAKLFSLPFKLIKFILTNGILGAVIILLLNFVGIGIELNLINALIAGVFGVPGVVVLLVLHFIF